MLSKIIEYLDDSGQCQLCPSSRCESCINSTYCSSCKYPFQWGDICEFDCSGCITRCNRNDGCSSGCSYDNHYITYNPGKKGYECIRCPDQCDKCLNETHCNSCSHEFWGTKCSYSCNNCLGGCSKSFGCVSGCKLGYYPEHVEVGYECKPCSEYCEQCIDSSTCSVCEAGYYFNDVTNICIACSINCKGTVCDRRNGSCFSGCTAGNTGHRCNEQCSINCVECDQFNSSYCISCKRELYGETCKNVCSRNCKTTNGIHECLKEDGSCKHGCEDSFWSKTCTEACPERCIDNVCNERSGKCSNGCKVGFHGSNCSLVCPTNCYGNKCFQDNGICVVEFISESTTSRLIEGRKMHYCINTRVTRY